MTYELEVNDLAAYLAADAVVDGNSPAILERAAEITVGLDGDVERAKALFEWVRDAIPHSRDAGREEVTCVASDVLAAGTGICYAKSHLLAALLRASGIPAGFCYQVYENEEPAAEIPQHQPEPPLTKATERLMTLHGLNGVYLASLGRWVRVDCRGNVGGVDAQFDTETERLAFSDLDFLDNVIYARPLPAVVRALQNAPSRSELWPHLPTVADVRR